ncbi:Thyrotropin-releasing hormone receptor, partial [Orchesella cincta]
SYPETATHGGNFDDDNSSSDAAAALRNNSIITTSNSSFGSSPINCSDPASLFEAFNLSFPEYEDPVYYSHSYRMIGTFFQGLIFLVGVLGNILVVFVVARTKSMHSPTNCYLVSLALADCIVLIAAVPQEIVQYYLVGSRWIWGDVGCALLVFFQNLGINASSLSLAAFTVERYIAICKPFLAQTVCTVNRAKRIIGGVWIFAFIYCFPWLFLTSTFPIFYKGYSNVQTCEHKLSREQYLGYYFTDIIVFYLIPLLLSVVLYSQIARILYKSQSSKSGGCSGSSTGNGNLTTDLSKPNAARVQARLFTNENLYLALFHGRKSFWWHLACRQVGIYQTLC